MNFEDFERTHLRLVILRALADQSDFTLNESILQQVAETYGLRKTRDHIKGELRWLADVDAIELKEIEGFLIATLKRKGQDHIDGRIVIDGVKQPGPKA